MQEKLPPLFCEPFERDDDLLPPLDPAAVDFREIRALAAAVLRRAMLDAQVAPRAALQEVQTGCLDFWIAILGLTRATFERHVLDLLAGAPQDRRLPAGEAPAPERPISPGGPPRPPRPVPSLRDLLRAVVRSGPDRAAFARALGLEEDAAQRRLRASGLIRRHERFEAFVDRVRDAQDRVEEETLAAAGLAAE